MHLEFATISECFVPSVVVKARQTCSATAAKQALGNLFNHPESGSKRAWDADGEGGTPPPLTERISDQVTQMIELCDKIDVPDNDAEDTITGIAALDIATRKARKLFSRCLTVDISCTTSREFTSGARVITIAPWLWNDVRKVIYDCATQARFVSATKYESLLIQHKELAGFLRTTGRAEGWRHGWVLSTTRKIEQVRVLSGERLACSEQQQNDAADLYLSAQRADNLQFHVGQSIMLSKEALKRLMTQSRKPDAWLNDTLIDGYMYLLQRRDHRLSRNARRDGQPYASTVFVHSLVYTELREQCATNNGVLTEELFLRSPTLHNGLADVRGARLLMACNGNAKDHWEVVEVDFRNKYVRHYCSMGKPNDRMLSSVLQWLKLVAKHRIPGIADCVNKMKVENVRYWAPQNNCVDCGVFALAAMDFLSLGLPIEGIEQRHCNALRVKYCWELFARKVASPGETAPQFSAKFKENLKGEFATGSRIVDMTSTDDEN
jgi:hypothetical protein